MRLTVLTPDVNDPEQCALLYAAVKEQWPDQASFTQTIQQAQVLPLAASFNDRYLALALMTHDASAEWHVSWFSVRSITRRRGVGKWLLKHVVEQAGNEPVRVFVPSQCTDRAGLGAFLSLYGFTEQPDQSWLKQP